MDEKRTEDVLPLSAEEASPAPKTKARPDKALVKAEIRQGKADGAQYLKEKRACSSLAETKAFRKKWRQQKKAWKAEYKTLDEEQRAARKKGRRAFRHRIHRTGRIFKTLIAVLLILCLLGFGLPAAVTSWRIYKSQKFTNSGAEVEIARVKGYALSEEIRGEGIVLLKNEEGFLPLQEKKLNVFGDDAYSFPSGSSVLSDALLTQGIACNPALSRIYTPKEVPGTLEKLKAKAASLLPGREAEDLSWPVPDRKVLEEAAAFSDQALILLSAVSDNGKDLSLSSLSPMVGDTPKARLIDTVCRQFEHVILVVFSGNVMELGFLDDYDSIDAVLWMGEPDESGCTALSEVLTGVINPSGRSTDTWPCALSSSPALAATQKSFYANLSGVQTMDFSEGIYVGYRYYETRYGAEEEAYDAQVVFPFGHGLSYTEFTEELTSLSEADGTITAEITVTNTGEVPGKDVVQLYFMPPEDPDGVTERSAIELAGFAKTQELAPGEEAALSIAFSLRDLSCWLEEAGCYLLPAGDYSISLGKDVHDALLSESVEIYTVEEALTYREDDVTGAELQNRFIDSSGNAQLLSRAAWEETFPAPEDRLVASDTLKQTLSTYGQTDEIQPVRASGGSMQGDSTPALAELKGLAYDDPKWDAFVSSFSAKEMIRLVSNGAFHTEAVSRLGVPSLRFLGGDTGFTSRTGKLNAVSYPSSAVLGASWNTELSSRFGEAIASEAAAYGISGWYAPNPGIRRTPLDAGNISSFSEDPLLCGLMSSAQVQSASAGSMLALLQGFPFGGSSALKDGVCLYVSEQALRQLWLRPFEIAVKQGGAAGISIPSVRLGAEWCSASDALLRSVLQDEWGFRGVISAEASPRAARAVALSLQNGSDLFFDTGFGYVSLLLSFHLSSLGDPVGTVQNLQNAVHDLCYAVVNTTM
ncbi:MAG: glycoside hydrolase family 3 C-terminal domain-containing protein [Oscillospiraceae bacterium]|nr:glycoside hydrolase family 3 C-terminal domain-containing protein [Oscillospiraceae bacterium]